MFGIEKLPIPYELPAALLRLAGETAIKGGELLTKLASLTTSEHVEQAKESVAYPKAESLDSAEQGDIISICESIFGIALELEINDNPRADKYVLITSSEDLYKEYVVLNVEDRKYFSLHRAVYDTEEARTYPFMVYEEFVGFDNAGESSVVSRTHLIDQLGTAVTLTDDSVSGKVRCPLPAQEAALYQEIIAAATLLPIETAPSAGDTAANGPEADN
jgi:hypothetical protein